MVYGGEDFTDMEDFGAEREEWQKNFLELPNGIPDSDTFRRVFERINPQELSEKLPEWLEYQREREETVSIDGKTMCGSSNATHKAYYAVNTLYNMAWAGLLPIQVTELPEALKRNPHAIAGTTMNETAGMQRKW